MLFDDHRPRFAPRQTTRRGARGPADALGSRGPLRLTPLELIERIAAPIAIPTALAMSAARLHVAWWIAGLGTLLVAFLWLRRSRWCTPACALALFASVLGVTLVLAEPLTATLLATVVLDETIALLGWLGVSAVLLGLFVVGRTAEVSIEPVPHSVG